MEGVRRDPEKCTFNPTTWSLTVVDDYVLYMFALSTPNLQRKLFGGGGCSTGVGNSIFLVNKLIGTDLAHFKSD